MSAADELDWGYVAITRGRHAGRVGFYDDDAERDLLVVYLETPWIRPYVLVRRSSVRRATDEEALTFRQTYENDIAHARAKRKLMEETRR